MDNSSSFTRLLPFLLQETFLRLLARMRSWMRSCSQFANKSPFHLCSIFHKLTGLLGNQTGENCCTRGNTELFLIVDRMQSAKTPRCCWYQHRQRGLRANAEVSLSKTHGFGFRSRYPSSDWIQTLLFGSCLWHVAPTGSHRHLFRQTWRLMACSTCTF